LKTVAVDLHDQTEVLDEVAQPVAGEER